VTRGQTSKLSLTTLVIDPHNIVSPLALLVKSNSPHEGDAVSRGILARK
jgi:hypothetical protein